MATGEGNHVDSEPPSKISVQLARGPQSGRDFGHVGGDEISKTSIGWRWEWSVPRY